ncbi:AAA family ATPase [Jatrophihabitans telluris]|uniref:AAA family ATPase n=1 Tax=Jatrophihabitans telluris TaxID=2038343 RepID=A0ABY4QUJ5_9ACTN|nr:ATP-binding protein [Jatrophihabitans telluris]UQX86649.1 AAA family ATPase [Jatrophihabitans telluris]
MTDPLLDSLRRALDTAPSDVELRLHVAALLGQRGDQDEAVALLAAGLVQFPTHDQLRAALAALIAPTPATPPATPLATAGTPAAGEAVTTPDPAGAGRGETGADGPESEAEDDRPGPPPTDEQGAGSLPAPSEATSPRPYVFDWSAAENELSDLSDPMFVDGSGGSTDDPAFEVTREELTLADVGGMKEVKDRLTASFLAPLRNPDLRRLYGKSLRGGLLLYGPPGCGKTFIARALAGELKAKFMSIGLADVLDPYLGNSERNLHDAFELARREAPCVLFFDEIDALAQRRTQTRNSGLRGSVNQLLTELDGVNGVNEGVFVLGATNQPWDIDPAMRRPGRFDRMVLVLPPDQPAREAIFRHHLKERPIEGIDLGKLAKASDGLSGADIAYVCELAAEKALLDGVQSGEARLIVMADVLFALEQVSPSTSAWFDSARNVVTFGNTDGTYNELKAFMKKAKRL